MVPRYVASTHPRVKRQSNMLCPRIPSFSRYDYENENEDVEGSMEELSH